jgi:hypothetical protein
MKVAPKIDLSKPRRQYLDHRARLLAGAAYDDMDTLASDMIATYGWAAYQGLDDGDDWDAECLDIAREIHTYRARYRRLTGRLLPCPVIDMSPLQEALITVADEPEYKAPLEGAA